MRLSYEQDYCKELTDNLEGLTTRKLLANSCRHSGERGSANSIKFSAKRLNRKTQAIKHTFSLMVRR